MGKRELLIIVAFVAAGAVAFELTAPPAPQGRGFSLSRFFQNARRGIRGNSAVASNTVSGEIDLAGSVTELRVEGVNRGVKILGESRKTVAYELRTESDGPDEATALDLAKKTVLKQDAFGSSLSLGVAYPKERNQWAALVLHVPARLSVRLAGSGGAEASGVADVYLDLSGSVTVRDVPGAVTGTHRNGDLTVTHAGRVDLNLVSSRSKFADIAREVLLNNRGGRCDITDTHGPIELDETSQEAAIHHSMGPVRVTGSGGHVLIDDPRADVKVDCRRTDVEATLTAAVPVTLLTTDESLRLTLAGRPAVNIDAAASEGGGIHVEDFDAPVKSSEGEQRCSLALGGPTSPRVTLRIARGGIVIRQAK